METVGSESLTLDYESKRLFVTFDYGISNELAVRLHVPFMKYDGGFLDGHIVRWHDRFGLPQSNRLDVPYDQFLITYTPDGTRTFTRDEPVTTLADIQLGLSYQIARSTDENLSTSLTLDLPTGDLDSLSGNEATDISLTLAWDRTLVDDWSTDLNAGVLLPGNHNVYGAGVSDTVYFGHLGLEWHVHEAFDIRLQANGHTAYYDDSDLRLMGSTYLIIFGGRWHITRCSSLDVGVSEDLKVNASPDVSFLLNWTHRSADCTR